jgi:hypothetical protein
MRMKSLTRERILAIAGELTDAAVAEIEKLGATEAELVEATERLAGNESMQRNHTIPPQSRVALLCDILTAEDETDEDQRRPAR